MKKLKILLTSILSFLILLFGVMLIYLSTGHYKPLEKAENALNSSSIKYETFNDYTLFDGKGEDTALIFYPGAKVDYLAYAPLCNALAENGVDCFLIKMPFDFAFFGMNKADDITEKYDYNNWYMAGHSLGGVVASSYASKNDKIDGVLLLASYSTSDLTNKKVLSIYGTNDGVLNKEKMQEANINLPTDAEILCIKGGNHAQFGDYGKQKSDNDADISPEEQIYYVINAFGEFINK